MLHPRRSFAIAAVLTLLLAGCDGRGSTDPAEGPAGNYALTYLGSGPLPFSELAPGGDCGRERWETVSGTMRLAPGGTWSIANQRRRRCEVEGQTPGAWVAWLEEDGGGYRIEQDGGVTFWYAGHENHPMPGAVAGRTIETRWSTTLLHRYERQD
jgi:hypothetical protein